MKTVFSILSLLACTFSLNAQITSTLNHLAGGLDEVWIQNDSAVDLVTFVVTVKQEPRSASSNSSPYAVYSDPLVDPAAQPLLPGEKRKAMWMGVAASIDLHGKRLLKEPILTAGIFSDGTRTGDQALLTGLVLRRSNMLMAVETALETLSDAGRRNVPRDQLIEQFKKMADSLRHWYLPPEQQIGIRIYQPIVERLMSLPQGQVGSPFPPDAFVAQETTILRQRRIALSESEPNMVDAFLASFPSLEP
jgi:hypothetical protein